MAIQLNGTNQYVRSSTSSVFGGADMAVMASVKLNAITARATVASTTYTTNYNPPISLFFVNGRLTAEIGYRYTFLILFPVYGFVTASATNVTPVNTWTHVGASWDGSTLTLYQDGAVVGTASTTYSIVSGSALTIGAQQTGNNSFGNYFNGAIEDFRYYNTAMASNWVETIANSRGQDFLLDNLAVWQPFVEGIVGGNVTTAMTSPILELLFDNSMSLTPVNNPTYAEGISGFSRRI